MVMFSLRLATRSDIPAIERVMRLSVETLGRTTYDERQVESSLQFITRPDEQLIDDRTYYVAEADGEIVGCGGWSRRAKLYTGSASEDGAGRARELDPATEPARIRAMFVHPAWARKGIGRAILEAAETAAREWGFRRLELMAMTSGAKLYFACGYAVKAPGTVDLPDGVKLEGTIMEKPLV
jgi:GNAT superfamily N-acetyltransferase